MQGHLIFPKFFLTQKFVGYNYSFFGFEFDLLFLMCCCLFIGAMGKSAQIPLHVWLPDSMEGLLQFRL